MPYMGTPENQDVSSSASSSDASTASAASSASSLAQVDDPVTIVGLACRVPGAENPSQLWTLMEEKRDVQKKIPQDRFNVDAFYHPEGTNKGTVRPKNFHFDHALC